MWLDGLWFVVGLGALVLGADALVRGASKLALTLGISPLVVGLTIVAFEDISASITLDGPLMEAYSGTTSMNVNMSGDFPTRASGMNAVSWSGNVIKVEVQPNWRYLP